MCGKAKWPNKSLDQCDLKLYTYNGAVLPIVGKAVVDVKYGLQNVSESLVIVQGGNHALLGRNWLSKLRLDWPSLFRVNACSSSTTPDFLAEFPEVFEEGLGTISEFEASIHLKDGAVPKSFPPRPVPYPLRGQVEIELERLEREGIIRKVDHAEWASPIVIVRKKNGSIRLCADFKVSINPFIEANQHPIPKPDDLLSNLSGCRVFSKLDLSQAYAQLKLSLSSQALCVISNTQGVIRFQPSTIWSVISPCYLAALHRTYPPRHSWSRCVL